MRRYDLGNFSFIVCLTIFIFALLGMQLFGGKMCGLDDGEVPRHNFDTLLWALVTVFQVLTGEDWNAVMYDGMAATSEWSALYFLLLQIVGNFLVLNLFVAILLTNFGEQVRCRLFGSFHTFTDASSGSFGTSMGSFGASFGLFGSFHTYFASCGSFGTSMGSLGTSMGSFGTSSGSFGTSFGLFRLFTDASFGWFRRVWRTSTRARGT